MLSHRTNVYASSSESPSIDAIDFVEWGNELLANEFGPLSAILSFLSFFDLLHYRIVSRFFLRTIAVSLSLRPLSFSELAELAVAWRTYVHSLRRVHRAVNPSIERHLGYLLENVSGKLIPVSLNVTVEEHDPSTRLYFRPPRPVPDSLTLFLPPSMLGTDSFLRSVISLSWICLERRPALDEDKKKNSFRWSTRGRDRSGSALFSGQVVGNGSGCSVMFRAVEEESRQESFVVDLAALSSIQPEDFQKLITLTSSTSPPSLESILCRRKTWSALLREAIRISVSGQTPPHPLCELLRKVPIASSMFYAADVVSFIRNSDEEEITEAVILDEVVRMGIPLRGLLHESLNLPFGSLKRIVWWCLEHCQLLFKERFTVFSEGESMMRRHYVSRVPLPRVTLLHGLCSNTTVNRDELAEIVELLLFDARLSWWVNEVDSRDRTPFKLRIEKFCADASLLNGVKGPFPILDLLLRCGADLNHTNEQHSCLDLAIEKKQFHLALWLAQQEGIMRTSWTKFNESTTNAMLLCKEGLELLKILMRFCPDELPPIHSAAKLGSVEAVRLFLAHFDCVNSLPSASVVRGGLVPHHPSTPLTPLMIAAENARVEVVEVLLSCPDIDILIEGRQHFTALHLAVNLADSNEERARIVEMLLGAASENLIPSIGRADSSAFELALDNSLHLAAYHLAVAGDDFDLADLGGDPMKFVMSECQETEEGEEVELSGSQRLFELAIQRGLTFDLGDVLAFECFSTAIFADDLLAVRLLVECGLPPNVIHPYATQTPVMLAARQCCVSILKYLIQDCGCDVTVTDTEGNSALHLVVSASSTLLGRIDQIDEVIKVLNYASSELFDLKNLSGFTPLEKALELYRHDCALSLVRSGASPIFGWRIDLMTLESPSWPQLLQFYLDHSYDFLFPSYERQLAVKSCHDVDTFLLLVDLVPLDEGLTLIDDNLFLTRVVHALNLNQLREFLSKIEANEKVLDVFRSQLMRVACELSRRSLLTQDSFSFSFSEKTHFLLTTPLLNGSITCFLEEWQNHEALSPSFVFFCLCHHHDEGLIGQFLENHTFDPEEISSFYHSSLGSVTASPHLVVLRSLILHGLVPPTERMALIRGKMACHHLTPLCYALQNSRLSMKVLELHLFTVPLPQDALLAAAECWFCRHYHLETRGEKTFMALKRAIPDLVELMRVRLVDATGRGFLEKCVEKTSITEESSARGDDET